MRSASYSPKESKAEKFGNFVAKQIRENKTRFLTIIGFVIGLLFFSIFIYMRFQTIESSASDRLSAAYMFFASGDRNQALSYLNDTISLFPKTPSAYQARLVAGDYFIEESKYDEALPYLQTAYEKAKPENMRPLALVRIIYLYDLKKDYEKAILYSNEFINKYDGNYLIKDVYMNLARFYILSGLPEDAKRIYNDVLIKFPATNEAAKAEENLKNF
ncbi:MAG: tetratricopeptide repeat protein [Endomicrobium sp.]|jgi:tetratricopeptide (TPR) repeat protein|nr:tetratricopeptide repeat protein [Endomicrobium sp.]